MVEEPILVFYLLTLKNFIKKIIVYLELLLLNMEELIEKKVLYKRARMILRIISVLLLGYLLIYPVFPLLRYKLYESSSSAQQINYSDQSQIETILDNQTANLPENEIKAGNRLIISKIGVNAPIVESNNERKGLDSGIWRMPETSRPNIGGNTVLTGHRFKYLPPNNTTLYSLNKVSTGDIITIIWEKDTYFYKVTESKIVKNNDFSILEKTDKPVITVFTCDPIFSDENRLVVTAEFVKKIVYLDL